LRTGENYRIKVRAVNNFCMGTWSDHVAFKTKGTHINFKADLTDKNVDPNNLAKESTNDRRLSSEDNDDFFGSRGG